MERVGLGGAAEPARRQPSHTGELRNLDMAIALATRPRLLLLDEPTAGMSPAATEVRVRLISDCAGTSGW